ncbi:hypothetical protein, partial [Rhodopseudomonas palustris]
MNIKASGHAALIIAAGLWVGLAGPMQITASAAASPDSAQAAKDGRASAASATRPVAKKSVKKAVKHSRRHRNKAASAKPAKAVASKPETPDAKAGPAATTAQLPAAIADAKAELPAADAPAVPEPAAELVANEGDVAPTTQPLGTAPASAEIVPPDQLNAIDLAASDDKAGPVAQSDS